MLSHDLWFPRDVYKAVPAARRATARGGKFRGVTIKGRMKCPFRSRNRICNCVNVWQLHVHDPRSTWVKTTYILLHVILYAESAIFAYNYGVNVRIILYK